jgi:hypothetical protein
MIFLGIDPGLHGALAFMDGERKQIEVVDCPLVDGEYDFFGMWKAFANAAQTVPWDVKSLTVATSCQ